MLAPLGLFASTCKQVAEEPKLAVDTACFASYWPLRQGPPLWTSELSWDGEKLSLLITGAHQPPHLLSDNKETVLQHDNAGLEAQISRRPRQAKRTCAGLALPLGFHASLSHFNLDLDRPPLSLPFRSITSVKLCEINNQKKKMENVYTHT